MQEAHFGFRSEFTSQREMVLREFVESLSTNKAYQVEACVSVQTVT